MTKLAVRSISVTIFLLIVSPLAVFGQNSDAACRAFINRSYAELGNNCAGLGIDEVCYGYGEVTSTFYVNGNPLVAAEDFGQLLEAGDQSTIVFEDENAKLENISGTQFVAPPTPNEDGEWGIAVAKLRMNLPQQLSSAATFILFGDTTIESGVLPENVFMAGDTVDVTVEGASIFNKPPGYDFDGYASEAIDTVSDTFEADAISPDGAWVRVFFTYDRLYAQRATAWLQTSDLTNSPDLIGLPELGPDDFADLQDIYIQASSTSSGCELAPPNGLFIQSPQNLETDIRINETPIRFNSSGFIDKVGVRSLRVSAFDGVVQINPGADDEVIVAAGEQAVVCLTDVQDLGIDGLTDDQTYDPACGIEGPDVFGSEFPQLDIPNNILDRPVATITIIRASGIGSPIVGIIIRPPEAAERIRELCEQGLIPGRICEFLR